MEIIFTALEKEICDALTERNISYDFGFGCITIKGFYKSGEVVLQTTNNNEGVMVVTSRYLIKDEIVCFDDLVRLNYDWWQRSKDRHDGWVTPEEGWKADFLRLGLCKVKIVEVWE